MPFPVRGIVVTQEGLIPAGDAAVDAGKANLRWEQVPASRSSCNRLEICEFAITDYKRAVATANGHQTRL